MALKKLKKKALGITGVNVPVSVAAADPVYECSFFFGKTAGANVCCESFGRRVTTRDAAFFSMDGR